MIQFKIENTPNPKCVKFRASQAIASDTFDFARGENYSFSPLAQKLFGFPWIEAVCISQDFITVTKQDWVDWENLSEPLADIITEHFERGGVSILPATWPATSSQGSSQPSGGNPAQAYGRSAKNSANTVKDPGILETDSPTVKIIKQIIFDQVRPAVARDGGDVEFAKYESNILYLTLKGSCNGCPSSSITLKHGIAQQIRAAVPELIDVVQI